MRQVSPCRTPSRSTVTEPSSFVSAACSFLLITGSMAMGSSGTGRRARFPRTSWPPPSPTSCRPTDPWAADHLAKGTSSRHERVLLGGFHRRATAWLTPSAGGPRHQDAHRDRRPGRRASPRQGFRSGAVCPLGRPAIDASGLQTSVAESARVARQRPMSRVRDYYNCRSSWSRRAEDRLTITRPMIAGDRCICPTTRGRRRSARHSRQ